MPFIPHDDILRYEEILRICGIAADLGVKTIRVTGGEPLVRKGCIEFIKALKAMPQPERVTLTTNGVYLQEHLQTLADIGLDGCNISLNASTREQYQAITGYDGFDRVWRAIREGIALGIPIKLNFVPIQGVNHEDILPMANLARELPVDVRFIELMPSRENRNLKGVSTDEVFRILKTEYADLEEDPTQRGFGPAGYFTSKDMQGSIGFIGALSDNFCAACNRLRLTSEGFLRFCLHHNTGIDLRAMLRGGADDAAIAAAIEEGVRAKPEGHMLEEQVKLRDMFRIGG